MRIETFGVEEWMNLWEDSATWNIAETCVESLTVRELLEMTGDSGSQIDAFLNKKLTYGHIFGAPELLNGIASLYHQQRAENILPAHGGIGANQLALQTLIEPGDEVIVVVPTYQQLQSLPAALGATVILYKLSPEEGFVPVPEKLEALITKKTRALIMNNPNNPTGAHMDETLLKEIVALCRRSGIWLYCDEVYRGLEHSGSFQTPSVVDLYEKAVATSSFSKVFSLAGLRLGWIVGGEAFIERCKKWRDYGTISCGVLDEWLGGIAIKEKDRILARNLDLLNHNAIILDDWMGRQSKLSYVKPRAGTTAFLKFENTEIKSEPFCLDLLKKTGAFLTPGSRFPGWEGWLRIGYAPQTKVLETGLDKLEEMLSKQS